MDGGHFRPEDYYWPAFRTSIREGKAKGVMCSYNAVPGLKRVGGAKVVGELG